jgi:hypothetical protein
MKTQFYTLFLAAFSVFWLTASCSSSEDGESTSISIEPRSKEAKLTNDDPLTKKNLFDKLELIIEQKIAFKSVSITYDELMAKFSVSFRERFTKDGGDVFKKFLPQWHDETEALLNDLKAGDIQLTNTDLKLDKEDTELRGYSGTVQFVSKGENITLGFAAFEVDEAFYINFIRDYGSN